MSRSRWVDAQQAAGFAAVAACRAAGVTRSAFDAWAAKGEQDRGRPGMAEAALVAEVRTIHRQPSGTYGRRGCRPSFAGGAGGWTTSGWSA